MPMYSKRRQSSSNSDELSSRYEFVDYTSVSPFEKFITHIEETLYSWGIKDGSFGIFSQQQLDNAKAAIAHPSAVEFTRKETLAMGDDVYQLTYHYHPTFTTEATTQPLAADHFYQYTSQYHPLHRWTGQDRIMVIQPMQGSLKTKIFNTTGKSSADMALAKHLISACAIAFHNTECQVPIFVPVGQSRHDMYVGLMVRGSHEGSALKDTETRFTMTLTTPPTSEFSDLDGLQALFLQKLNVHRQDYGLPPTNESNILISAVYTYNLKNWFDENWKDWEDVVEVKRKLSFSDDFESWGDEEEDTMTKSKHPVQQRTQLSFGAFNDPLRSLTLSALFPLASEEQFHQDYDRNMDALAAKQWQLSREFAPANQQRAYLSTLIEQVIDSWVRDPSNREYLAPYDDSNDDATSDSVSLMRNLFTAGLTTNKLASSDISSNSSGVGTDSVAVIKSEQVEHVLTCLFHPMPQADDKKQHQQDQKFDDTKKLGLRLKQNASVPYRSFLWNFLLYSMEAASNGNNSDRKQQHITHFMAFLRVIWLEVLRQLRWHWENSVPIPDLDPHLYDDFASDSSSKKAHKKALGIDLRYNMLHQKISMINCCIHRRLQNAPQGASPSVLNPVSRAGNLFDSLSSQENIKKESAASKFQSLIERFVEGDTDTSQNKDLEESVSFQASDIEEGDSDVFVDANENADINEDENQEVIVPEDPMQESFLASLPYIPSSDEANAVQDPDASEGQLHMHETLTLLKTGEPMKVPVTQDPGFMTEDMISEQADVFEKLGTSEKATQQRARLQSAQLYSDMQAFKAANPHACLEDFVRWHSPRDWIADEQGGHLSTRMSEPKNIWQELWKCSKRIPSSKQRPLFNEAVEAEKALYFLETTSVHEFMSLMLPTLGLIAYDTLASHPIARYSQHVSNGLVNLGNNLVNFAWHDFRHGKRTFDHIITDIRQLESMMCHSISLLRKLPKQYDLVDQLLVEDQAIVKDGSERSAVFQLFRNDQGIISQPSYREYLLYSNCQDMTCNERVLPQRQYTIIKDNEIRMMDMQTTDALYY